ARIQRQRLAYVRPNLGGGRATRPGAGQNDATTGRHPGRRASGYTLPARHHRRRDGSRCDDSNGTATTRWLTACRAVADTSASTTHRCFTADGRDAATDAADRRTAQRDATDGTATDGRDAAAYAADRCTADRPNANRCKANADRWANTNRCKANANGRAKANRSAADRAATNGRAEANWPAAHRCTADRAETHRRTAHRPTTHGRPEADRRTAAHRTEADRGTAAHRCAETNRRATAHGRAETHGRKTDLAADLRPTRLRLRHTDVDRGLRVTFMLRGYRSRAAGHIISRRSGFCWR
ncbi:MAG: hypothetical protein QOG19_2551, partial [Mycobacterium sp.]|nr:hypothetical protein [Mycobacterium sp.]